MDLRRREIRRQGSLVAAEHKAFELLVYLIENRNRAIDNLVGGTAGIAIQCMNLMFGLEETAGLGWGGMTV